MGRVISLPVLFAKKDRAFSNALFLYFTSFGLFDRKSHVTLNSFQFTQHGCGQPAQAPVQSFCWSQGFWHLVQM